MPHSFSFRRPRRALVAGVGAVAAVALLASCSSGGGTAPSGSASADDSAPVTLTMAVESVASGSPYGQMAKNYTAEHPNVTINVTEIANESLPQVINTQLQGGQAPDLFYVTGGSGGLISALPLAQAGYLKDLSGTPAEGLLNDSTRKLYDYDGKVWAQPLDNVAYTTNWNTDFAKKLGISAPTTYSQVLAACKKADGEGTRLYTIAGAAVNNMALMTAQIAASRVYAKTPDWDEQRAAGKVTFAGSAEWKASLQTVVDMQKANCFNQDAVAGPIANNTPNVVAARNVASFSPTGALADMKRQGPNGNFAAYAFPGTSASDTRLLVSPSNALAVNAKSDPAKQKAALAFLDWLAQPKNSDALAQLSGNLSITAGQGGSLPTTFKALEPYVGADKNGLLPYLLWPNAKVTNSFGTGVQGLLSGQTTIDAVLKQMDTDWG